MVPICQALFPLCRWTHLLNIVILISSRQAQSSISYSTESKFSACKFWWSFVWHKWIDVCSGPAKLTLCCRWVLEITCLGATWFISSWPVKNILTCTSYFTWIRSCQDRGYSSVGTQSRLCITMLYWEITYLPALNWTESLLSLKLP